MRSLVGLGSALVMLALVCGLEKPAVGQLEGFSGMTLNGTAALSVEAATLGQLILTEDGDFGAAASAFKNRLTDVTHFSTSFDFHLLHPSDPGSMADGITFTMQTMGPSALGGGGGCDGYCGISPSVAVKFDTFDNGGETDSNTQLLAGGVMTAGISTAPVDLRSQDEFHADITYVGTTLSLHLVDTTSGSVFDTFGSIDIPVALGSKRAFIGFTAGTGGATSLQEIEKFTFVPEPSSALPLVSGIAGLGVLALRRRRPR